jgi:hypothetical protein
MDDFSRVRNTSKSHFFAENCANIEIPGTGSAGLRTHGTGIQGNIADHPIGQVRVPIWRMRKTRALPQCGYSGHRRGS